MTSKTDEEIEEGLLEEQLETDADEEADEVAADVESRLVPFEEPESGLQSEDTGPGFDLGGGDDGGEPGDDGHGEFGRLDVWAQLKRVTGAAASNGNAFSAVFEFQSDAAGEAVELIGQETFKVIFSRVEVGEARLKGIGVKPDEDSAARASMTLEWAGNQLTPWSKLVRHVGKGGRLELETVQLALDLTTKA